MTLDFRSTATRLSQSAGTSFRLPDRNAERVEVRVIGPYLEAQALGEYSGDAIEQGHREVTMRREARESLTVVLDRKSVV